MLDEEQAKPGARPSYNQRRHVAADLRAIPSRLAQNMRAFPKHAGYKGREGLNRTLRVHVDKSTWPGRNRLPAFPAAFHSGWTAHDVNVTSALLLIGYLTTPISSTGVSLSEFWAWVRYVAAVTPDADLRLTRSFFDLDAHQKTILSDDFGMGFPMLWLNQRLPFDRIVDGRYFMQRIAASVGATQRRTAKRGPNKTPDFVARDTSGVWHVIECKGTQSGVDYSRHQLGEAFPRWTGGVAQKRSIEFPRGHTGQRLACGLAIGVAGGTDSVLTIIDPEPEEPFKLTREQLYLADDAATRGVMSKALRLAGFDVAAETTAAPLGRDPDARRYASKTREEQRVQEMEERDRRAREELDLAGRRDRFVDGRYIGRERIIQLPRPVLLDEQPVTRAIVRQSVGREILAEVRARPTVEEPIEVADLAWTRELGQNMVKGDERTAMMTIGDVFRSELILE